MQSSSGPFRPKLCLLSTTTCPDAKASTRRHQQGSPPTSLSQLRRLRPASSLACTHERQCRSVHPRHSWPKSMDPATRGAMAAGLNRINNPGCGGDWKNWAKIGPAGPLHLLRGTARQVLTANTRISARRTSSAWDVLFLERTLSVW
jgi:hypothetical protein